MFVGARGLAAQRRVPRLRKTERAPCFLARSGAALDVSENYGFIRGFGVDFQLRHPAARPLRGARGEKDLHLRVGRNHSADVAPVEHGAGRSFGKIALQFHQRRAHFRVRRHDRGGFAYGMGFQRALIEAGRIEGLGGGEGLGAILERMAGVEQRLGDRAVEQPRIEMAQAEMRRQAFAQRPLAGRGRPVDGDDHFGCRRCGQAEEAAGPQS